MKLAVRERERRRRERARKDIFSCIIHTSSAMPPLPLVEAHSACGFTRKSKDHAYSCTETCTHTQKYTYTYICMPVDIYIYFGVAVN